MDTPFEAEEGKEEASPKPTVSKDRYGPTLCGARSQSYDALDSRTSNHVWVLGPSCWKTQQLDSGLQDIEAFEELLQRAAAELPPMANLGPSGHIWELTEEEVAWQHLEK